MLPVAEQQAHTDDRTDAEIRVEAARVVSPAARADRGASVERQVAGPPVAHGDRAHRHLAGGRAGGAHRTAEPVAQRERHRAGIESTRLDADVPDDRVVIGGRRDLVGGGHGPDDDRSGRGDVGRRHERRSRRGRSGRRRRARDGRRAGGRRRGGGRPRRRRGRGGRTPSDRAHSQHRDPGPHRAQVPVFTRQTLGGAIVRRPIRTL